MEHGLRLMEQAIIVCIFMVALAVFWSMGRKYKNSLECLVDEMFCEREVIALKEDGQVLDEELTNKREVMSALMVETLPAEIWINDVCMNDMIQRYQFLEKMQGMNQWFRKEYEYDEEGEIVRIYYDSIEES